jgi:acetyl esterase/lipase
MAPAFKKVTFLPAFFGTALYTLHRPAIPRHGKPNMKISARSLGLWLGLPFGLLLLLAIACWWYWFHAPFQRLAPVEYGRRDGRPLVFEAFRPPTQNGAGVLLMVSGGWKSGPGSIRPELFAPFLRRGYTVFAIQHISQPDCTISGIVEDVNRAVRYVRLHAAEYGVDGARLGVIGGSSGGHLSLMLGTTGRAGDPAAADLVQRESSAVQCVACFYPPTDLLNLGSSTENPGDGGPPKSFVDGFGIRAKSMATWRVLGRELSPIYHVSSSMPPTFIVHGDADTLVPLDQSRRFVAAAEQTGATVRLEVREGQGHGWPSMIFDIVRFADWFDQHLAAQP